MRSINSHKPPTRDLLEFISSRPKGWVNTSWTSGWRTRRHPHRAEPLPCLCQTCSCLQLWMWCVLNISWNLIMQWCIYIQVAIFLYTLLYIYIYIRKCVFPLLANSYKVIAGYMHSYFSRQSPMIVIYVWLQPVMCLTKSLRWHSLLCPTTTYGVSSLHMPAMLWRSNFTRKPKGRAGLQCSPSSNEGSGKKVFL